MTVARRSDVALVCALVLLQVGGCVSQTTPNVVASPATLVAPVRNAEVEPATVETAGADACSVGSPGVVGPAVDDAVVRAGFGTAGGLVVWQAPGALMLRALSDKGLPASAARELPLTPRMPENVGDSAHRVYPTPVHVIPLDAGFVVVARVPTLQRNPLGDGTSQPDVAVHVVVFATDMSGSLRGSPLGFDIPDGIKLMVSPSDSHRFMVVTDGGQMLEFIADSTGLIARAILGESHFYGLLPIQGNGPPSFIAFDDKMQMTLLTTDGILAVEANDDPPGSIRQVIARHGTSGRIHLAWRSPYILDEPFTYSLIENGKYRILEHRSEKASVPSPFNRYVSADLYVGARVKRRLWTTGNYVGQTVKLLELDPNVPDSARLEWTGTAYVALYVVDSVTPSLRVIPIDCN